MIRVASILDTLFQWAPASLAWEKDNIGLLVGSTRQEVHRILVCLDVTEAVIEEALTRSADLIVAHHPLIFRPLYSVRTDTQQGRMLESLLRNGIAVIAMHTNADAAPNGLNYALATRLGLRELQALEAPEKQLRRLELRLAAFPDAAVSIGQYFEMSEAESWYMYLLTNGELLLAIDVMKRDIDSIAAAIQNITGNRILSRRVLPLEDALGRGGIGFVGELDNPSNVDDFLELIKQRLGCVYLRVTHTRSDTMLRRIAVCGGAGSSYVRAAIASGAQCFVTGDLTHHTMLDYGSDILLVDAGHHETEFVFVELCAELLESASFQESKKIDILRVRTKTNPLRFV